MVPGAGAVRRRQGVAAGAGDRRVAAVDGVEGEPAVARRPGQRLRAARGQLQVDAVRADLRRARGVVDAGDEDPSAPSDRIAVSPAV